MNIIIVAGPTASGKSKEAIRIAKERDGEVISVDSRQVYRGLDIGTEKMMHEEMQGVPHYLIDIREPNEPYSAGDFVKDAEKLIDDISVRGKLPILAGGTHFYFDALLHGLPESSVDEKLRKELELKSTEELAEEVKQKDPVRFARLDPHNRRRLIRALEIIALHGHVPPRAPSARALPYAIEWVLLDPPKEVLQEKIKARLKEALNRGLIEEVKQTRERYGDERLNELGLEYKVIGEYLRGERTQESLLPTLSTKLWHYARRQKAWLRKLKDEAGATHDTIES